MKNNNMKCENCGKNEASFHYSSNINGNVTEKHLCSECAARLGYGENMFFDTENVFEDMLSGFFGRRRMLSPFGGFGFGFPAMTMTMPRLILPRVEICIDDGSGETCEKCGCSEADKTQQTVDTDASKQREINALCEQMKKYAENEEFEKAAEVRDKLRSLRGEDSGNGESKE